MNRFNASEEEKRNQRMRRNTKLGVIFGAGSIILGFTWFCIHYGKSPRDENGLATRDEFSGSLLAPFRRIRKHFHLWMDYVIEPSREVLLPSPIAPPYYQPKYTLVMELKNILVAPDWSYTSGYRFIKRPALDYFLTMIKYPNFEVVLYTSESAMSAHQLVESLDPDHCIMYKLYRDCTKYMNGHHVKVLSQLNRDMSKVIFIDHDPKSFQLNPENVLRIPKWEGNMDDTSLVDLAELLKTIHLSDVDDVRPTLQYYSQFDDPAKEFRRRAVELAEKVQHTSNDSLLKRYTGKLFGFRRHAVS
ncbi:unnamed protein product [Dracunculus medinensis]|uniref:Mitochondrial import inner membrane translocase subunit TIM50 n=1 Tax=Dracunculus medinensis TaxID=318479 RepID=A0A0N4U0S3_DRAME|nr:unnamed protein product [Dracunculus medinensis]